MYLGRIRPGNRGERNPQREIGNRASTYESVWQAEIDPRVHRKDGGGVLHVPGRTEAEGMKPLRISKDNRARSHDHQARRSAGHRGQEGGRQEA